MTFSETSVPPLSYDILIPLADDPPVPSVKRHLLRPAALWATAMVALCVWTAWRLGGFDLTTQVPMSGGALTVPNAFSTVDHPFHAARGAALLESLQSGHLLRWIGNHQGGYPAEFYPIGVAWLDVAIWALLVGTVPILAVHKLAVILVFLLPAVGFWILARAACISPGIAVLAMAAHIAIPGGLGLQSWTTGGFTELVQWGLVTNVAGATLGLIAFAFLIRFVAGGHRWQLIGAVLAASGAAFANPRSLFAIVVATVAIVMAVVTSSGDGERLSVQSSLKRIALVGGMAGLLAMPILLPLLRYRNLYYFVRYESYENLSAYWTASLHAVSPPLMALAIAGAVVALLNPSLFVARAISFTLIGYVFVTAWLSLNEDLVQQLETPRLMPFQRFLTLFLAAFAVWWLAEQVAQRLPSARASIVRHGVLAFSAIVILVACLLPLGSVPELYRGLLETQTMGNAEFVSFDTAIDEANGLVPSGTAMLVVGTVPTVWKPFSWDWHAQLLGPTRSDVPFFYNDWLWNWHDLHVGTPGYNYLAGNSYPDPAQTFDASYLGEHGIGVVVVTHVAGANPDPRTAARGSTTLEFRESVGEWDIYAVREPLSIVTDGQGAPSNISVANERITASFAAGDGDLVIRRNWFPRWQATVNGDSVPIERTADGYMRIAAPKGAVELSLTYTVTAWDWIGRFSALLGGVSIVLAALGARAPKPFRMWLGPKDKPGPDPQSA